MTLEALQQPEGYEGPFLKAKIWLEYELFESGQVYPSKLNLARYSNESIPVIKALQEVSDQCSLFLILDAFGDKFGTDHEARREWQNGADKEYGEGARDYFRNTRLSSRALTKLTDAAVRAVREMKKAGIDVNAPSEAAAPAFVALAKLRGAQDRFSGYSRLENKKKYEAVSWLSDLARDYLHTVTA